MSTPVVPAAMPEQLQPALERLRRTMLDPQCLVRAVASGRRRGSTAPQVQRVVLRPVLLKAGPRLQIVAEDGVRPTTTNVEWGPAATEAVEALLAQPYGNWHVAGTDATLQLRVTKKGMAQLHVGQPAQAGGTEHDRAPEHLLDPGDPLYQLIGGNAAKRRQVDAFLRQLMAVLGTDLPERLHIVDSGCGNAYLTFAAYRYLSTTGTDVRVTGIDVRADQRKRNSELAEQLGCSERVRFVAETIARADLESAPDAVIALHACDTATDEALAMAVGWGCRWILAAPCCHHDLAKQLRGSGTAEDQPWLGPLLGDGILRERLADTLTDALRAALLRSRGYQVDVVEFIDSAHTPRNLMLRATRRSSSTSESDGPGRTTGPDRTAAFDRHAAAEQYTALCQRFGVRPALETMLERP